MPPQMNRNCSDPTASAMGFDAQSLIIGQKTNKSSVYYTFNDDEGAASGDNSGCDDGVATPRKSIASADVTLYILEDDESSDESGRDEGNHNATERRDRAGTRQDRRPVTPSRSRSNSSSSYVPSPRPKSSPEFQKRPVSRSRQSSSSSSSRSDSRTRHNERERSKSRSRSDGRREESPSQQRTRSRSRSESRYTQNSSNKDSRCQDRLRCDRSERHSRPQPEGERRRSHSQSDRRRCPSEEDRRRSRSRSRYESDDSPRSSRRDSSKERSRHSSVPRSRQPSGDPGGERRRSRSTSRPRHVVRNDGKPTGRSTEGTQSIRDSIKHATARASNRRSDPPGHYLGTPSPTTSLHGSDQSETNQTATSSTSLQLLISDPGKVDKLVAPRTCMTVDSKYTAGTHDDDELSIFSELWDSIHQVPVKMQKELAVMQASNPQLEYDLSSPTRSPAKTRTQKQKGPAGPEKHRGAVQRHNSLSTIIEADREKLQVRPRPDNNKTPAKASRIDTDDLPLINKYQESKTMRTPKPVVGNLNHAQECAKASGPQNTGVQATNSDQLSRLKDAGLFLLRPSSMWFNGPSKQEQASPGSSFPSEVELPETSETAATSVESSDPSTTPVFESLSVPKTIPKSLKAKEKAENPSKAESPSKASTTAVGTSNRNDDIQALSSILDSNTDIHKTVDVGFSMLVEPRQHRFQLRPGLSNTPRNVFSSAQRVLLGPKVALSAPRQTSMRKCYDMRGLDE